MLVLKFRENVKYLQWFVFELQLIYKKNQFFFFELLNTFYF